MVMPEGGRQRVAFEGGRCGSVRRPPGSATQTRIGDGNEDR